MKVTRTTRLAALVAGTTLALTGCGGGSPRSAGAGALSGTIRIDGSSTVAPLSEAASELFREEYPGVQVTVGTSGTGGGFEKLCAGEIDLANASRPMKAAERGACAAKGVAFEELTVANDALSVVVSKDNDWVDCLTVAQLKAIWEPKSKVSSWRQVDPAFPDVPLKLFGAGTDSGTFDYFTKQVNGKEGASRTDYNATEDDNVTVQGVAGDKGGLGYFGFSYFEENADKLKALAVDGGTGCVPPSVKAVQDGSYAPLARPLFVYPTTSLLSRPEGMAFVQRLAENAKAIAEQARFVPLTSAQTGELSRRVKSLQAARPSPASS